MWSVGVIVPLREIYKPESALTHWVRRVPAYGAAVLASGAALGLSLLIPSIADKPFFLLFFLATAGCAWLYGIASGLTSILLNTLALIYFVLPPRHSLRLADSDDVVRLSVFVVASGAIAWAMARLRSTQQALTLAQERFELAHEIAKIWSWELDLATGKVTWSSTVKRRAGQHEDPVQIWLELVHADAWIDVPRRHLARDDALLHRPCPGTGILVCDQRHRRDRIRLMALLAFRLENRRDVLGVRHALGCVGREHGRGDRQNSTDGQQTLHQLPPLR